MQFQGKTALISGGLGDIGRAIASELAVRGADIALCDLQPAGKAKEFLAGLRARGRKARYDRVDVTDAAATAAWVSRVEESLGTPSLIVPNAAQVTVADCRRITPSQWDRELRVNLDGAFYVARSAALRLIAQGAPGRIVFVGSWAAHRVHAHIPAYAVAKAGLRMLAQCMALEFASHGILVNEVAPGIVDAGLSGKLMNGDPELRETHRRLTPVGKLVEPADVARMVAFLCDPENRQMTGSVIVQDGGLSLLPPTP